MDSTSLCSPVSLYFPLPCEMLLLDIHFLVDMSSLSNMTMPFHCLPASTDEQSATSSTEAPPLWRLFVSCCLSRFFSVACTSLTLMWLYLPCLGFKDLFGTAHKPFSSNLESFQSLFSKTLLCPFPLLSWDSHYMDVVPLNFEALFIFLPSFFSLFFRMHNFYCSMFKFPASNSFLNLSLC